MTVATSRQRLSSATGSTAAELLAYVYRRRRKRIPDWVKEERDDCYGGKSRSLKELCEYLRGLDPEKRVALVYRDIRDPMCRRLGDWYEQHRRGDEDRGEPWREI